MILGHPHPFQNQDQRQDKMTVIKVHKGMREGSFSGPGEEEGSL